MHINKKRESIKVTLKNFKLCEIQSFTIEVLDWKTRDETKDTTE